MPESSGGDLGGVTIGAREIYDELVAMRGDVRSLTEGRTATDEMLSKLDQRVTAVERWTWAAPAALLSGVASVVTVVLTALYIK